MTEEELKAYGEARQNAPWEQAKAPPQSVIIGMIRIIDVFVLMAEDGSTEMVWVAIIMVGSSIVQD